MASLLNRLAWFISLTLAIVLAFLISDAFSGTYSSGAENFFEWGWVWGVLCLFFIKGIFFSETLISRYLAEDNSVSSHMITMPKDYGTEESEDVSVTDNTMNYNPPSIVQRSDIGEEPDVSSAATLDTRTIEPEKPNWLVVFFSDRPLAKIGGILLFLGALFFLSLVWNAVGSVGKILIGLVFGFTLYIVGVWMDRKGNIAESRTLLGVGIAINTLTILSGRWIIGDGSETVLSDIVTLIFLLLNTIFAIVTALIYTSQTFLIFSFVFAYLIPFLVRSDTDSASLTIIYIAIISLSGYFLAYFLRKRDRASDALWLGRTVLIGSTVLMALSGLGLSSIGELIIHIITLIVIAEAGLFLFSRSSLDRESIPAIIICGYIMLTSALLGMGDSTGTLLIYIVALIPLMFFTVTYTLALGASALMSSILLIPLVFGVIILSIFGLPSLLFILLPILFFYSIAGFFVLGTLSTFFQYIFFISITLFLSVFSFVLGFSPIEMSSLERGVVGSSVILFCIISLWASLKYSLHYLSVVSIVSTTLLLALILTPGSFLSWMLYGGLLVVGFIYPFIGSGRGSFTSPVSAVAYLVVLHLFMIGELFYLGKDLWFIGSNTSLITLGVIVFCLSVFSLIYGLLLIRKMTDSSLGSLSNLSISDKNMVAGILALPLSLFSLAVAVIFSKNPLVVSTIWILESTILAYFSGRTKNTHILVGSLVLLAIGLIRLIPFFETISSRDWFGLIPLSIIALAIFFSAHYLPSRDDIKAGNFHDILHIFGMMMVGYALMEIIPHTTTGWSLLGLSMFLGVSTWFYAGIKSTVLSLWNVTIGVGYFFYHFVRVGYLDIHLGPVLLQLFSLFLALLSTLYFMRKNLLGRISFAIGSIATLIITSLYVNEITNNVFAVTIYLTIVSTIFLLIGINQGKPYLRTIGLYIGSIVLIKILCYDLWVGVDNLVIRVVALMVSGGIMIGLSQLYGRRVNRSWGEEFSFSNFRVLMPEDLIKQTPSDNDDMPFTEDIASDLRKLDISHIASIRLKNNNGEVVFESKRVGVIRIVNYITTSLQKAQFAPTELESVFQSVTHHIKSSLPKKDLDVILENIANWIKSGGSIEIVRKSNQ